MESKEFLEATEGFILIHTKTTTRILSITKALQQRPSMNGKLLDTRRKCRTMGNGRRDITSYAAIYVLHKFSQCLLGARQSVTPHFDT
jgi:hypothetical protein